MDLQVGLKKKYINVLRFVSQGMELELYFNVHLKKISPWVHNFR